MRTTPQQLPDADYTLRDQEHMKAAVRYFQWQYQLAEPHIGRRVLEVGCGIGNVTKLLLDRELVVGIDVEERCVTERARRFSTHAHVVTRMIDVVDPDLMSLAHHRFDTVLCMNVLEHIRDDRKALEHMHGVLDPGGTVILIVPAFESLFGPIDVKLGHYRRYSRRQVAGLARAVGFECAVLRYMNMVGMVGWWFNARVLRRDEQSDAQIRFFDSWIVPILSRTERVVHPICGQNVFAVLRKVPSAQA
jgi:SAM-dependent methyltransferase